MKILQRDERAQKLITYWQKYIPKSGIWQEHYIRDVWKSIYEFVIILFIFFLLGLIWIQNVRHWW